LYHGWSDPAISPLNTIDYYTEVQNTVGASAADSVRPQRYVIGHRKSLSRPAKPKRVTALMEAMENQMRFTIAPTGLGNPSRLSTLPRHGGC
jgi:hypothetical protein